MCNSNFNHRLAPANKNHVNDLKKVFPKYSSYIEEVYGILTKDLSPQVNLLVLFTVLKVMYDKKLLGIFSEFGNILYAPLSIVAKTGDHEWTRFRPKFVEELHTSFLSFMMAKPNRIELNKFLGTHGLCFSQGHCCGVLFGSKKDVKKYEKSDLFKARNLMRSYAESMAMPVVTAEFDNLPIVTSDLGESERLFYKIYEYVFSKISIQQRKDLVDENKNILWEGIIRKVVVSENIKTNKSTPLNLNMVV